MTEPFILTEVRGEGPRRTGLITLNRPKPVSYTHLTLPTNREV